MNLNGKTPPTLPEISVIVPAYNAHDTLLRCLSALQRQTVAASRYEIIVVDDASTDDTVAIAQAANVTKVISRGKLGKSGVRNAGAQAARGAILLFTDADCEPQPDWIEQMVLPFTHDADVVGVKGAYLCRQTELVARFTQVEVEERYDRMAKQPQIDFIDTYAAGYRRDIFLENNGFDETLPEVEDQDFSFRLAAKGYKMVFAPDARVYHWHLVSAERYFKRKFAIATWKAMLMHRHPERLVSDSRTPQSLKVQMLLALALLPLLPLTLVWRPSRKLFLAGLAAFGTSCLPFVSKSWGRDKGATLIALPMLLLRSVALSVGYIYGLFHLSKTAKEQKPVLAGRHRLLKTAFDYGVSAMLLLAYAPKLLGGKWQRDEVAGQNGRPFQRRQLAQAAPRLRSVSQMVNVLGGKMSLVGPRAEAMEGLGRADDQDRLRLAVKPGIFSPAPAADLNYLQKYTFSRDLQIFKQAWHSHLRNTDEYEPK